MSSVDRRRVTLAAMFTVVALPALWIASRDDGAPTTIASTGVDTPTGQVAPTDPTYVPDDPAFFPETDDTVQPPTTPVVMTAPPTNPNTITGTATFRRYGDPANRPCTTQLAPAGVTITVTNIDTGATITCVNTYSTPADRNSELVITTDVFAELASLSAAPIPVRMSW